MIVVAGLKNVVFSSGGSCKGIPPQARFGYCSVIQSVLNILENALILMDFVSGLLTV